MKCNQTFLGFLCSHYTGIPNCFTWLTKYSSHWSRNPLFCSNISTFSNKGISRCLVTRPIPAPQSKKEKETFDNNEFSKIYDFPSFCDWGPLYRLQSMHSQVQFGPGHVAIVTSAVSRSATCHSCQAPSTNSLVLMSFIELRYWPYLMLFLLVFEEVENLSSVV